MTPEQERDIPDEASVGPAKSKLQSTFENNLIKQLLIKEGASTDLESAYGGGKIDINFIYQEYSPVVEVGHGPLKEYDENIMLEDSIGEELNEIFPITMQEPEEPSLAS